MLFNRNICRKLKLLVVTDKRRGKVKVKCNLVEALYGPVRPIRGVEV